MKSLIRKALSELRHQAALGVQEPLDSVHARVEATTGDLRREVGQLRAEVEAILPAVRAENDELTRMLRQQGDAADGVAEVLGRTLARLGAEVEALSTAVERLETRLGDEQPTPAASGVVDRPE